MRKAEIETLLERVRGLKGPDRDVDRKIMVAVFGYGVHDALPLPAYTASLDAIVELVKHDLPGGTWTYRTDDAGLPTAEAWWTNSAGDLSFEEASGATEPLALCAALLLAKLAITEHSDVK